MSHYRYAIRLRGRLTPTLLAEFEDLHLSSAIVPVETVLEGPVDDDAALHGLLRRIEALGLELVEVRRLAPTAGEAEPESTNRPPSAPRPAR